MVTPGAKQVSDKDKYFSPVAELGQTGLRRYSGFIHEEYEVELRGRRGVETFKEMENDSVVGATLFAIQMLIRQVDWHVEAPQNPDMQDLERADFLQTCFDDMSQSWNDTLIEILSMLPFGWSFHETVYKMRMGPNNRDSRFNSRYSDARVGWRKLPIRGQDSLWRWEYESDQVDNLVAFSQLPPPSFQLKTIPMTKGLLFRPQSHKNNPEGRSILRSAYTDWYYKKNIQRIEAIGIERDLAGLPIIRVPPNLFDPNASGEDKAALEEYKKIVTNLKRDEQEGVVFPNAYDHMGNRTYDIELLTTGGSRQINTDIIVQRYDRRIAMSTLADFLFVGHQSTGSFALIDNKTDLFVVAIGSYLDAIAEVFNRFAIPRLWRMNGWEIDRLPKWIPGDIEKPDLAKLGTYISQLAGSGVALFPDKNVEDYLKRAAGLPVKEEIEEDQLETPEPTESNRGTTSMDGNPPHNHNFVVDDSGNGLTNSTSDGAGHTHTILNGVVREAGNPPHSHTLA